MTTFHIKSQTIKINKMCKNNTHRQNTKECIFQKKKRKCLENTTIIGKMIKLNLIIQNFSYTNVTQVLHKPNTYRQLTKNKNDLPFLDNNQSET